MPRSCVGGHFDFVIGEAIGAAKAARTLKVHGSIKGQCHKEQDHRVVIVQGKVACVAGMSLEGHEVVAEGVLNDRCGGQCDDEGECEGQYGRLGVCVDCVALIRKLAGVGYDLMLLMVTMLGECPRSAVFLASVGVE